MSGNQCSRFISGITAVGIKLIDLQGIFQDDLYIQILLSFNVEVILRKMFWLFSCTPLKVCLQLMLLLEKDSSFDVVQNAMKGYRFPAGIQSLQP